MVPNHVPSSDRQAEVVGRVAQIKKSTPGSLTKGVATGVTRKSTSDVSKARKLTGGGARPTKETSNNALSKKTKPAFNARCPRQQAMEPRGGRLTL